MSDVPLVLVTEGSAPVLLAWLSERGEVVEAAPSSPAFHATLPEAEGMVVRTHTNVTAELLARCPRPMSSHCTWACGPVTSGWWASRSRR